MQSANVGQGLQDAIIHCTEQTTNAISDWDASIQEVITPVNNFQEKELGYVYYPYSGSLKTMSMHEPSWLTTPTYTVNQSSNFGQDQDGKKKSSQEFEHDDIRCVQFGCLNATSYQEMGNHCSLYFHDKSDAELLKQQQNNMFLSECDLAKLSDLAPDIINLEGSVNSELLKVVDSEDDEEDLIVDDSETESEISVSDAGSCVNALNQCELYCMVCGLPRSHTVEANFLQVNSTYPLTFVSKTPVFLKLVEIVPSDMHLRLNLGDNLICRRCFNLIDTAENLELRLMTVKQELCDFVARTQSTTLQNVEINQRNLPVGIREKAPAYNAALMAAATAQSIHMAEFQRHVTTHSSPKYGTAESIYFGGRTSSYGFNTSNDNRFTGLQNEEQSVIDSRPILSENGVLSSACNYANTSTQSQNSEIQLVAPLMPMEIDKEISTGTDCNQEDENKTYSKPLEQHPSEVHSAKQIAEKECDNKTSVDKNLEVSEKRNPDIRGEKFQCDRCGRTYTRKFKLMNHLMKHDGIFRFKCEHCSKGFSSQSSLTIHLRSHKDIRPYLCDICHSRFPNADDLNSHKLFCFDKKYPCCKCSKVFASADKLSEHMGAHNKDYQDKMDSKQLKCEICSKIFRYHADLINHSASHNNIKSYRCRICSRSYKHKRHLNRHLRDAHSVEEIEKYGQLKDDKKDEDSAQQSSSERTVTPEQIETLSTKGVCPICNKHFTKLKIHMISHTNIKKYRCEECNVDFSLKQGLVRHMRHKHPSEHSNKAIS